MINILIVDDSKVQQELLTQILTSDPEIRVIGTASSGDEALKKIIEKKPDVVTMDIHMPKMDGIEATQKIMSLVPLPIIIISGSGSLAEVQDTFKALEAGAVAVIEKMNYLSDSTKELIQTIKLMSEIKVVKRHTPNLKKQPYSKVIPVPAVSDPLLDISLIAVGASTGGPMTLLDIFSNLGRDFPPILVVQHISPGFLSGLVEWLSDKSQHLIKIASHGELPLPSHIYLAPDGVHLEINAENRIVLSNALPEKGHRPSVSVLFRSVARNLNQRALGILLTGMGRDGVEGLKLMRNSGAYTIAQDEASSIIYGMPKEALENNAVTRVMSPVDIANFIKNLKMRSTL